MAPLTACSCIFLLTLFHYEIIEAGLIPFSFDELFQFGMGFLICSGVHKDNTAPTEYSMMQDISSKIDNMEKAIKLSETTIINEIGYLIQYHQAINDYTDDIDYIRRQYHLFQSYAHGIPDYLLQDFAKSSLTNGDNGLSQRLDHVVKLVAPVSSLNTGLLELIVGPQKAQDRVAKRCDRTTSLQQDIYRIYEEILMYIIKGYAIKSAAYDILTTTSSEKYELGKEIIQESYKGSMLRIKEFAVSAMRISSRDIRSCDPKVHQSGKTHIELKWLFNSIVLSEVFLNKAGTCSSTCENYINTQFHPYIDLAEVDKCPGTLYRCSSRFASDYCVPTEGSPRRYGAIYKKWGMRKNCTLVRSFLQKFQTIQNWGLNYCDWCTCYCDSYHWPDTVRSFSMRPVQSNSSENMVITGLRFVEKNQVIYIQIQEGKLEANGSITSEVEWQPIDEIDIKSPSTPIEDYFPIKYYRRAVNLDTLFAPVGEVMTGIKLSFQDFHLGLEIRSHAFDYGSGTLANGDGVWRTNIQNFRKEIKIENPDIPTLAAENIVNTEKNTYVNFRMTDLDKDSGQTAVPFIDAQPVFSYPPQPLAGAGIYYRGQSGYGGFIGLKLLTHDYAALIDHNVHSEQGESQLSPEVKANGKTEQHKGMEFKFELPENAESENNKKKPEKPAQRSRRPRKLPKFRLGK